MDILSFALGMKLGKSQSGGGGTSGDERVKYVTFMRGEEELLKYPVISGDTCHDPVSKGLIATPTKEQTVSTVYTYSGWSLTDGGAASSSALANVTEDRTVYVAFAASARKYTANFYDGSTLKKTEQVGYGSKATPPDTLKDGYDFVGWTPSDLTITGDTDFYGTWEVDQGWLVARVAPTQTAKVQWPTYSADGTRFFFARDYTVYMYDATTQPYTLLTSVTPSSSKAVKWFAVSPNGEWLAVAINNTVSSVKDGVYVYSIGVSTLTRRSSVLTNGTTEASATMYYVTFSPDSTKLVTYSGYVGKTYHIYTVGGSSSAWSCTSFKSPISNASNNDISVFSPDGTRLAVTVNNNYYNQNTKILDASNGYSDITADCLGTGNTSTLSFGNYATHVAYSPDGKYLAFGLHRCTANVGTHQKRNLLVYDTTTTPYTLVMSRSDQTSGYDIQGVAFSADGSLLALTIGVSPYLLIYDTGTWTLKETPMVPPNVALRGCNFSANNHLALGSTTSPYLYLYEVKE